MAEQIGAAVIGLSGGLVIAGGVIALMVGLGIITRFAGITHTAGQVKKYESAIFFGALFGNILRYIRRKCRLAQRVWQSWGFSPVFL